MDEDLDEIGSTRITAMRSWQTGYDQGYDDGFIDGSSESLSENQDLRDEVAQLRERVAFLVDKLDQIDRANQP